MGREVRRVPPNWKHPETQDNYGRTCLQPMHDETFDERFTEWLADFDRVRAGNLTDTEREWYPRGLADWLMDEGAPLDPAYYRPWQDDEATWFQLWETVSEGTPVSPPFATKEELAAHLAVHGDAWDQARSAKGRAGFTRGQATGWGMERARAFVEAGWAPSMMVINEPGNLSIVESKDIPLAQSS